MASADQDLPELEPDPACPAWKDPDPDEAGGDSEGGSEEEGDEWRPKQARRPGPSLRARREAGAGAGAGEAAEPEDPLDFSDEGLRIGYSILQDLMKTNLTFLHRPKGNKEMIDYEEIIEQPMWFTEIERRYEDHEYPSVEEFISDIKLLLSNTYRYFGPDSVYTKRALRIEQVLTKKLSLMPKKIKTQCLQILNDVKSTEDTDNHMVTQKGGEYHSVLLEKFSGEREERQKKQKQLLEEERKALLSGEAKAACVWEADTLLAPPAITQMRTMWELPLIGHLIQLTSHVLSIDEMPQFELERMFLMPQASKSLARLMTSLLSPPLQRSKLHSHPPMPYTIWSRKLCQKVANWYKLFNARHQDTAKVFELCGIEKDFWGILGNTNQLEEYEYHELSFHQRVWLVKTLCDFLVHHHKTMQDALAEHSQREQDCEVLGEDQHKRQYLHFPQFYSVGDPCTCVRVYRRLLPVDSTKFEEISSQKSISTSTRSKRNFLPSWIKGRKGKKLASRKSKLGSEMKKRNFLSRQNYRMPNGMYIKQCKKRKRRGFPSSIPNHHQPDKPPVPSPTPLETELKEDIEETRRLSRRSRNVSMGQYAEWSESDSQGTLSPSGTPCKTPAKKRAFSAVSVVDTDSSRGSIKLKLVSASSSRIPNNQDESSESGSDESEGNEAEKSQDAHDSGCEDGTSRSSGGFAGFPDESEGEEADDGDRDDATYSEKDGKYFTESLNEDAPLTLTQKDSGKERRALYDPHWLLLGAEHFQLVAESVQGIRDLIQDLNLHVGSTKHPDEESKPLCERKLKRQLLKLIDEVSPLELKMEKNVNALRRKLFSEWQEFRERPAGYVDESESFWLGLLSQKIDTGENSKETSKQLLSSFEVGNGSSIKLEKDENGSDIKPENEDSQTGGEIRHSLRTKRPKVDMINPWLHSDSDLSESDDEDERDDAWEMPKNRKKKKPGSVDTPEKKVAKIKKSKKVKDLSDFLIESNIVRADESFSEKNPPQSEKPHKVLPNKLTIDKENNMFITLSCGTRVQLKTNSDGKIVVPDGHEELSMINGKTLEQLVGAGKVVQNKRRKPKTAKRSTTLFPATPISETEREDLIKDKSCSELKTKVQKLKSSTSSNNNQNVTNSATVTATSEKSPSSGTHIKLEEIVILSDESDDSIEVIKEAKPKKVPSCSNNVPRIQAVIGNANINSFAPKPLTNSVTMIPVISPSKPPRNLEESQWNPVISNACSLEQITPPPVRRVRSPGKPQVVITPAKFVNIQRNSTQTSLYPQPPRNENFVSVTVRPSQSQFVPVTHVIPNLNQPLASSSPFTIGNITFPTQYLVNPQNYQLSPLPATQAPVPLNAHEIGLSPGLVGQIVLAENGSNANQYSYAFKLDDGGLIFLSSEQISRIRAANGVRFTDVTFCTR